MNATQTKATFENLARRIEQEAEQKKETAVFFVEHGYIKSWNASQHVPSDRGIEQNSTRRRWEQYRNGEITRDQAVKYATARRLREIDKETIKKQNKLIAARDAEEVKTVSIVVEWRHSSVWGYNPTALVTINGKQQYGGTASGCGYDKLTAAVGTALNQSPSILRMLYEAKEKALENMPPERAEQARRGFIEGCETNRDFIHYGAGYGVLPYFEGGVGMSSFYGVFEACGLKLTHENHASRTNSYYYFERV